MSDRRIQQLPASLVNRIAAGEVIERPASVVKELVENAIDAGSSQIIIEVEDGGLSLIRITDNGRGINPADLPLAFAPHATSKLTSDEDLFRIATMGFRGEALASIGSVSHARIVSRVAANDAAYEITNRGGAISDPQAAAGNVGTTVEVRNLFYNTPARRKFLRGPATEYGHVSDMVLRLALPHPQIAFKLLHNGRVTLDLPPTSAEDRLLQAWPKDFHEQRLAVDAADAEIRLRGIIGLPELARPTGKYQYLYLNGRHIRDKFIMHALREAYRGLTEPGRYPAAVLLLEMPPQDVDVNVHPTKIEVRFRDGGRIHGLVLGAVRECLLGSDLTPRALPTRSDIDDARRDDMRTKLAEFFKGSLAGLGAAAPQRDAEMLPNLAGGRDPSSGSSDFGSRLSTPESQISNLKSEIPDLRSQISEGGPSSAPAYSGDTNAPTGAPAIPDRRRIPAIQLHNSYLVAESEDGLIIIDQHALHERIMYEELLARISRGPLESQQLLIPATFPAGDRQLALLEQIQPLLARLGIDVVRFGPNTAAVQAFPSFLSKLDPATFVQELLERGEQELLDLHEEELLHEVLDMMACKAAIKAGDPLTPEEISALLARRELVERSSNCPHGRPTTLRLSLKDLEKQFKRTGF